MRRAVRVGLIGAGLLAVLAALGYYALRDSVLGRSARTLEQTLGERLGATVTIGRLRLELVPLALVADDVTIRSAAPDPPAPLLTVGRITAKPSLISLLTKTQVIRSLVIERPNLQLATDAEGRLNVPFLRGRSPSDPSRPPPVLVRRIDIVEAELTYRSSGRAITLHRATLALVPDMLMAAVDAELTAPNGALAIGDRVMALGATQLSVSVDDQRMAVTRATIEGPGLSASAQGALRFGTRGEFDLTATVSTDLAALAAAFWPSRALAGHLAVQGRIDGPLSDPRIAGDVAAHAVAYDGIPIGNLAGRFAIAGGRLSGTDLAGDLLGGRVRGSGAIALGPSAPAWSIAVDTSDLRPVPLLRRLIPSTAVSPRYEASGPIALHGRGRALTALTGRGRLALSPLDEARDSAQPVARVRALLDLLLTADLPWAIEAGRLRVNDGVVATDSGRLALDGTLSPTGDLDLGVRLTDQDAAAVTEALRSPFAVGGVAAFDGRLTGTLRAPQLDGRAGMRDLTLRGRPAGHLATTLRYADRVLAFRNTEWRKDDASYDVAGALSWTGDSTPGFDVTARLHRAQVRDVLPIAFRALPIDATADGTFTFRGSPADFLIAADLTLGEGSIYGQPFDEGRVAMTFDRTQVVFSHAELRRGESEVRGTGTIAYQTGFQARFESPRLHLQTLALFGLDGLPLSGVASAALTMSGTFDRPEMHGSMTIGYLEGAGQPLGPGRVQVDVKDRVVRVQAVLDDQHAQLDGTVHWQPGFPVSAVLTVDNSSLIPLIRPWLPAALSELSAVVSGRVALEGPLADPRQWRVESRLTRLSADVGEYVVENHGDVVLTLDGGQLDIGAFSLRGTDTTLTVTGGVDLFREYRLVIVGEADLRLTRLFVPTITSGRGKTYLVLKISDAWDSPKIQGGVTIQDAHLKSRAFTQTIHVETMGLFFNERQILLESLDGTVGNGRVSATGQIHLKGFRPERFGYLIDLSEVEFPLSERLLPTLSGQLIFQGTPEAQSLRGELTVDRAVYEARIDIQGWVLELRRRAERQDAGLTGSELGRRLALNIHFSGREDIGIKNNLADIPLEVDLFLKGTADRPYLIGRIEAREGTMMFRSNEFRVQSVTVDFVDPTRIRPVIDLRATTKVQTYAITMQITGTIDRFDLDLTSDPSLSETDILALLTVGRTAEQVSRSQSNLSRDEAASIALQALLEEGVQRLPGVDRLVDSVQIDPHYDPEIDQSAPRISVGKQLLDDRLIVRYTTTLDASSRQGVRVEYELARNVFLIGEQDYRGFGGDVRFRFEFR
ncbi:MAG: translocation/assembly module TamB domain-containing protein [Nitrospiria bacterium]